MYVFFTFFTFFSKSKKRDFLRFLSCCTRFPEQWRGHIVTNFLGSYTPKRFTYSDEIWGITHVGEERVSWWVSHAPF